MATGTACNYGAHLNQREAPSVGGGALTLLVMVAFVWLPIGLVVLDWLYP